VAFVEPIILTVGGTERRYLLARPEGKRPSALVLALHGMGAIAAWADPEARWSAHFTHIGFTLAVPDGLPPNREKPPKFLTNPPRWNDRGVKGQGSGTGEDDVAFLAAVVEDAARRAGTEPRACVTGFSNGAGMAFRFAAERADLVTALAPVAGHCWVEDPKPGRPIPTLYLIGTDDPLIPLGGGPVKVPWANRTVVRPPVVETLTRWAAAIGCEASPDLVRDANGVREEVYPGPVEFRAVFVEGLGHHWPGGKGQLSERIGGRTSDRVNANELIGEFFQRFQGEPGASATG
jgi:polyhydroxybutyrate depolymerase